MIKKIVLLFVSSLILPVLGYSIKPAKQFYLYDAMSYAGKPELTHEGLLPVFLMYEVSLTKKDPNHPKGIVLDFDKINDQAELASLFPGVMVSTDIEHWYYDATVDDKEMAIRFDALFSAFRKKIPDVFIGNYGVAPSALCVHRFYRPTFSDDSIINAWRKNNFKRWIPLQYANVAQPSVYIAEPNIESWINDLKITVSEIKQHAPDKKIIVYLWPQYYDKKDSPYYKRFIDPVIWRQMLEATFDNCDGAIIWSSRTDETDKTVNWHDPRVQANWKVTKEFIHKYNKQLVKPQPLPEFIQTVKSKKPFKLYADLNYKQMPDLKKHGIEPVFMVNEKDVSTVFENNIYQPDSIKIAEKARAFSTRNPAMPVCIDAPSWIRDRMSDNKAMVSRFEMIQRIFKNFNKTNPLLFTQVSPTNLSSLRVNSSNFFTNIGGWKISAVNTTIGLSKFADILMPASYSIDNDTTTWKKEFFLTIREAKKVNEGKPVYVHFNTDYFNIKDNFNEAYTPVEESTWLCMLNAAYHLCDGVILTNLQDINWSDNFGFWKATRKFLNDKSKF